MELSSTPRGERIYIGFFGMRNAGKSSVVNAFTNQDIAIVSNVKGTTTDPVYKAMELLPLGPVVITDTPGFDDSGELGELRVRKTKQILEENDMQASEWPGQRTFYASDLSPKFLGVIEKLGIKGDYALLQHRL